MPHPLKILKLRSIAEKIKLSGKKTDYHLTESKIMQNEDIINTTMQSYPYPIAAAVASAFSLNEHTSNEAPYLKFDALTACAENITRFIGVIVISELVSKPIAEGGSAFLHKAINMNTGAETVVKILKFTDNISMKERFRQESELMSQINSLLCTQIITC